jgi:hypothetical protein
LNTDHGEEKRFSFYLKDRKDAIEVDGAKLQDDGARITVVDETNAAIAVFLWSELQGYTVEE